METSIYPKAKSTSRSPRTSGLPIDPVQLIQTLLQRENKTEALSSTPSQAQSLEPVVALLRTRIDAKRARGETYTSEAVACYLVSEVMGDDLSAGFAAFDLYLSEFPKLKGSEWDLILSAYRARHSRIENLYQEIFGSAEIQSETTRVMKHYLEQPKPSDATFANNREINTLLFIHLGIRVDLTQGKITQINLHDKTKAILEALRGQAMEKCDFFTKVWGLKTFSIIKHDTVIRTALKRAREQAQIAIRSRDLRVELDPTVLVIT